MTGKPGRQPPIRGFSDRESTWLALGFAISIAFSAGLFGLMVAAVL